MIDGSKRAIPSENGTSEPIKKTLVDENKINFDQMSPSPPRIDGQLKGELCSATDRLCNFASNNRRIKTGNSLYNAVFVQQNKFHGSSSVARVTSYAPSLANTIITSARDNKNFLTKSTDRYIERAN